MENPADRMWANRGRVVITVDIIFVRIGTVVEAVLAELSGRFD